MKKLYFLFFAILISGLSFGQVFITELADPNNNAEARYIELYNAGGSPVDFTEGNGWQIDKYTNASTTVSTTLDLTGTIPAGGFYIIAYNNTDGTFASVYGFAPDQLDSVSNGVAGSNGDDDLVLVDGTDTIVDFFGVPDVDNTGTCAEYENGRAERLTSVTTGSATFNEAEWNIWADSATSGTCTNYVVATRDAPGDFDPGAWGTPSCAFYIDSPSATCDAVTSGTDTYTATVDFTGGGTSTYTVSTGGVGTVDLSGGDPDVDATGTITVTGIPEGTDVTINVTDGSICDVDYTVYSPTCQPALTLPLSDDFSYSDGSLVDALNWNNFSGTSGDLLVSSGQVMVKEDGSASEDASIAFTSVSGDIFYAFDFTVPNPGGVITGADYEYFALFKDDAFVYNGRIDIVEANSGGDYTVGIATSNSTADAIWATDLTFGTTYRATVRYNQDSNIAQLWIDATSSSDTSIMGADETDPGTTITQFGFRQSSSSSGESILVDNLVIASTFNGTLSSKDYSIIDGLEIYPNPTTLGYINIFSKSQSAMKVGVFDILGKQVMSRTVENNRLDVSTLTSGLYIMKISQDNATATKKLVVK